MAETFDRPRSRASLRLRASMLREGCEDPASIAGSRFLGMPGGPAAEVLDALAADHFLGPARDNAGR